MESLASVLPQQTITQTTKACQCA